MMYLSGVVIRHMWLKVTFQKTFVFVSIREPQGRAGNTDCQPQVYCDINPYLENVYAFGQTCLAQVEPGTLAGCTVAALFMYLIFPINIGQPRRLELAGKGVIWEGQPPKEYEHGELLVYLRIISHGNTDQTILQRPWQSQAINRPSNPGDANKKQDTFRQSMYLCRGFRQNTQLRNWSV